MSNHLLLYKRWIHELWAGEPVAEELVSDDFVGHWPARDVRGAADLAALVADTHERLRELEFVTEVGPIIDGDMLAARWIGTGATDSGPVRYIGNDILRIRDDKIVEYWVGTARA